MHSGSFLLALYQPWLQRCKSGPCVYMCVSAGRGGRSYFLGARLSAGADYTFVGARMWPDECEYANACVFLSWQACASRGIGSQALPGGVGGAGGCCCHFKGPWGSLCQPARRRGGNPVYVAGPCLAGPAANTAAWRLQGGLPPPRQVRTSRTTL